MLLAVVVPKTLTIVKWVNFFRTFETWNGLERRPKLLNTKHLFRWAAEILISQFFARFRFENGDEQANLDNTFQSLHLHIRISFSFNFEVLNLLSYEN